MTCRRCILLCNTDIVLAL